MSEEKTEKTNSLLERIDRRKYFKRTNISDEKKKIEIIYKI